MSTPELYPPKYFCLSQVYKSWVKLFSKDIYALHRLPGYDNSNVWHWLNHPIRFVELLGIIVGIEDRQHFHIYDCTFKERRRLIFGVDDSSGITIDLVIRSEGLNGQKPVDEGIRKKIDVGNLVKARGFIVQFRDLRQLDVVTIEILQDWNLEIKGWNERVVLKEKVLLKPWVIKDEINIKFEKGRETSSQKRKLDFKQLPITEQTPANLKLLILQYLETNDLHDFTISHLRSTPEIEDGARLVAQPSTSANVHYTLCQVLKSLIHDGNIILENQVYIVIGEWNIGEIINQQAAEAKRKSKNHPNLTLRVSKVWAQVTGRGGPWRGVSKGVVGEIIQDMLLKSGKWRNVGAGRWAYTGYKQ
ncbi:CST complex subunit STN1 [Neolecta irregularis DAH-3]|uniref:CST complex subunit STN1 n=1 Tax=Neolecta irregularis (strain DAH-3) TaxID=1198029 RepID=A0A1U7LGC9_NEOID|nr:CST complex subunit STN1 [Neolecta irregularis DAH-3]|eukprot:OLL21678.1 CST complex subunit STN1 [Neolecta irregularis DAH-3]